MIVDQSSDEALINPIFSVSESIRYVALKTGERLVQQQRPGVENASAGESDRYEELFVNPALLSLAGARGDLDCGGFHYLIIRYGNFFQIVFRLPVGHLSVCVEESGDPQGLARPILEAYASTIHEKLQPQTTTTPPLQQGAAA